MTSRTSPSLPTISLTCEEGSPAMRRAVREGTLVRIRRGAYRPPDPRGASLWERQEWEALTHAAAAWAPIRCEAMLSHTTAARLHGLWVGPWDGHTHLLQRSRFGHACIGGVHRHEGAWTEDDETSIAGLRVTALPRTILDCARFLDPAEGLPIADSGLRILARASRFRREESLAAMEVVRVALLSRLAETPGQRGVATARAIIGAADGLAESAGESRLRGIVLAGGLPRPECQFPVVTPDGVKFIDLGWRLPSPSPDGVWALGGEYDGMGKYAPSGRALYNEKRREDAIVRAGVPLRRWIAQDLADDRAVVAEIAEHLVSRGVVVRGAIRPIPALRSREHTRNW